MRTLLVVIILVLLAGAAPRCLGQIEPYAENRRYWQYDGEPVLLLGGSGDDNLFQWAGDGFGDRLALHLDLMTCVGANYIRNAMNSRYDAVDGYNDAQMAYPFRPLDSGRYDLDQWNDDYWNRLERFLRETHRRRIFVQLELWDRDTIVNEVPWSRQPWNPDNNVNYSYDEMSLRRGKTGRQMPFFEAVLPATGDRRLKHYQDRYIAKMLEITLGYDHVLYQINNESPLDYAVSDYWASFIHNRASAMGRRAQVCDSRRFHKPSPYVTTEFRDWNNPDVDRNDHRLISGQFLDHGTQADLEEVSAVHKKTGRWLGMVGGDYYGRAVTPDVLVPEWKKDADWTVTNPLLIDYWKRGGLVTICLHPINPQTGNCAWMKKSGDTIDLTGLLSPTGAGHDEWIRQLDLIAQGLQELEDAGVVVLFRPFHEMNGDWFWWGSTNTPDQFVRLWRHMFHYLTDTKGLDNLLWVYSPGSGRGDPMKFYPGDRYVDMTGLDAYGRTPKEIRGRGYLQLTRLGKPFWLTEFGPFKHLNYDKTPRRDYDYGQFVDEVKQHLPMCTAFCLWHQYHGLHFHKNARGCLEHPWVVNREDLPRFGRTLPGSVSASTHVHRPVDLSGSLEATPAGTTACMLTASNETNLKSFTVALNLPTRPPDREKPYPPALKTVDVTPVNAEAILRSASRAEPGTHFVFSAGEYDLHNVRFGGVLKGTKDKPYVFRGEGKVVVRPKAWNVGEFGAILSLYGQHVWIDNIEFDLNYRSDIAQSKFVPLSTDLSTRNHSGRIVNINSHYRKIVSDRVTILNCKFYGSWRHAIVAQGTNHTIDGCYFDRNCRYNWDGGRGVWPAVCTSWWYWRRTEKKALSENFTIRNCRASHNFGEMYHFGYVRGGICEDCYCEDPRFVAVYFNNCSNIVARRLTLRIKNPVPGRGGNNPRAVYVANESYSTYPLNAKGNGPALFEDIDIDGGPSQGFNIGLGWNDHQNDKPEQFYSDWTIRRVSIRNCVEPMRFDEVTPNALRQPKNCTIDRPIDGFVGNPEAWEVVSERP